MKCVNKQVLELGLVPNSCSPSHCFLIRTVAVCTAKLNNRRAIKAAKKQNKELNYYIS
jgi:hypothetical protein